MFWNQGAALVPYMFCNFYLVKNHKIAYNSATTEAIEKMRTDLESLEFEKFFDVWLKTIKFYSIKLATDFKQQPSFLVGERASLTLRSFLGRDPPLSLTP